MSGSAHVEKDLPVVKAVHGNGKNLRPLDQRLKDVRC